MPRKNLTSLSIELLNLEASICLRRAKKGLDELYYACLLGGVAPLNVYAEARTIIGQLSRLMATSRALSLKQGLTEKITLKIEQETT